MITKVIIPVGGFGTRRLPISKAIEKCMLPVCNRPIVDYTVEECIANGITDFYFVVSPDHAQLETYYGRNDRLENYLRARGKDDMLTLIEPHKDVRFHYIVQGPEHPCGTAVPIWLAREIVGDDEQFVVMMGDDFLFAPSEPGANLRNMLKAAEQSPSVILAAHMPPERISLYGVIKMRTDGNGTEFFEDIVEKPAPGTEPSDLINVSKYILHRDIFPSVEETMKTPSACGEHLLTDTVNDYVTRGNAMAVVPAVGQFLDGGNLAGWVEANNVVFAAREQ
ncbi:MAG TPA: sugar phosphate nucleotidyltransferase [Candidatus Saccharimonadales bacterium]